MNTLKVHAKHYWPLIQSVFQKRSGSCQEPPKMSEKCKAQRRLLPREAAGCDYVALAVHKTQKVNTGRHVIYINFGAAIR